jgi:hypothetical protein
MTASRTASWSAAVVMSMLALACGDPRQPDAGDTCVGELCDLPDSPSSRLCPLRRADAFNKNEKSFTKSALRWSCEDVDGVTSVDRGQEYCEYFAIVRLPPTAATPVPEPQVLGKLVRFENPADPDDFRFDVTRPWLELDASTITNLEADESSIVGQCVFTSWNSDMTEPLPCQAAGTCPDVLGVPMNEENFQMKFIQNSTAAAGFLVEDCMCANLPNGECIHPDPLLGDPKDPADPRHDDFTRGCIMTAKLNKTEFRKSDTTLCASVLRLAECGCKLGGNASALDFALAISPSERRGFPLGTWSDPRKLPPGCRFVEVGDSSQTIVTCNLSAADVLTHPTDLKQLCREKYGPNVVVHVPIDPVAISCDPTMSESPYAATCTETPWVVTDGK